MNMMAKRVFSFFLALPAILFLSMGIRWLVNPEGIAPQLGLSLETGAGLSSQIGDFSSFFLVLGLSILLGLVTGKRVWFYPAAMLLLLAATGRLIAWIVHGAALVPQAIVFEIVIALLVLAGARFLTESDS